MKILALLAILAVAVTSLVVVTHEKKEPIVPEFSVYDTDGEWIDGGEAKIFGNRTIKPGDSGSYMFIVNNPHSVDLYCIIRFTVNYENKESLPPVRYQVKSEGQTLKLSEIENGFAVYGSDDQQKKFAFVHARVAMVVRKRQRYARHAGGDSRQQIFDKDRNRRRRGLTTFKMT